MKMETPIKVPTFTMYCPICNDKTEIQSTLWSYCWCHNCNSIIELETAIIEANE